MSIGSLLGGFIFSSTLVFTNALFNTDQIIEMPKYSTIKELIFYLLSILIIIIFGFFG